MIRPMPTVKTKIYMSKKPASKDWHKADIIGGLWKLNTSIQKLSRENNYKGNGLEQAIRRCWPKGERIIAEALGTTAPTIWPSRYHADGTPKSGRGERKHTALAAAVNGPLQAAHGKFVLKESERRELSFLSFASSQRPDEC